MTEVFVSDVETEEEKKILLTSKAFKNATSTSFGITLENDNLGNIAMARERLKIDFLSNVGLEKAFPAFLINAWKLHFYLRKFSIESSSGAFN